MPPTSYFALTPVARYRSNIELLKFSEFLSFEIEQDVGKESHNKLRRKKVSILERGSQRRKFFNIFRERSNFYNFREQVSKKKNFIYLQLLLKTHTHALVLQSATFFFQQIHSSRLSSFTGFFTSKLCENSRANLK